MNVPHIEGVIRLGFVNVMSWGVLVVGQAVLCYVHS